MRVVITGGTGLIGRALAKELVAHNYEVVLLSRHPGDDRKEDNPRVVRWDGWTAAGWQSWADGAVAIVNLAGANLAAGRWTAARKQEIIDSRVNAGRAVVEAVRGAISKPMVIQASGAGYYGPRGDELLAETAEPGDDFLARVARRWEDSTAEVESLGVRRTVLRMAAVLSDQGGALPRLVLPYRFYAGGALGDGRQWFPWVHLTDVTSVIRFLIESPDASGVYNVAAPSAIRNAEFGRALGRVLGRPYWLPVPALALRLILGDMASMLLDGQRIIPQRLLDSGFVFRFDRAENALQDLLARTA